LQKNYFAKGLYNTKLFKKYWKIMSKKPKKAAIIAEIPITKKVNRAVAFLAGQLTCFNSSLDNLK